MPASKKLLAITMSPRESGNSDLLLEQFIRGAETAGAEVELIRTSGLDIEGCTECGGCDDTGECILSDDMDDLYSSLIEADRVVVAAPIFFYGLPAKGKALVDRCQALWNRNKLNPELKRPQGSGFFLGVGATKGQNLFEGTELCIKYFLDAIGLPLKLDSLTYRQVEDKGAIKDHPTALNEAYQAGKAFMS